MKTQIVFVLLLLLPVGGSAQTERRPWEAYLGELMTVEDVGTAQWEDTYELLCELEQHPMDINTATREQLEQLPFLSAQQVEELMEYQYRYGPMKSAGELLMISSLGYEERRLLTYFIYIGEENEEKFPSMKQITKYGHHELMATGRIPFYERKGDRDGYLGPPYRHWLRYQFAYGDYLKMGLVGAQDAGEPFFANQNKWGYDYYSPYLQLRQWGRLETLVLGRYRASMGMGLILNSSFSQGKVAMLQNLGRPTTTLRAHSSRSEADYLQGAGASVSFSRGLTLTAFVSYRGMDATLNKDGTVSSIVTSGYHRTETEMAKKHNLHNTTLGGSLRYNRHGLHFGANAVYSHLDKRLSPNTSLLYRQHYAQGNDFLNVSADYGYVHHRFALNGETAVNGDGALATINSVSLQLADGLSAMLLQRFYSYRYTSLYARCFSDGGSVQNESGIYLGLNWQPLPSLKLMVYTDYAYFPWAKYQISLSSHSWDNLLQLTYTKNRWTLGGRYRLRLRQRDNPTSENSQGKKVKNTTLMSRTEHRGRLSVDYAGSLTSRTQLDFSLISFKERERGLMVSQTLGYTHRWLRLNGGVGYFKTDSYDSRVYLYEQGPLYTYSIGQFQGEGIRYWLMARAAVGKRLSLTARLGVTNYFDRSVVGSSYQQVDGSALTDMDVQVRWKF